MQSYFFFLVLILLISLFCILSILLGLWKITEQHPEWPQYAASAAFCESREATEWLSNKTLWRGWINHPHCWSYGFGGLKPRFYIMFNFLFIFSGLMDWHFELNDHINQPWSVPEVLRPLYESSTLLAQRTTMAVRISCIPSSSQCCISCTCQLLTLYSSFLAPHPTPQKNKDKNCRLAYWCGKFPWTTMKLSCNATLPVNEIMNSRSSLTT